MWIKIRKKVWRYNFDHHWDAQGKYHAGTYRYEKKWFWTWVGRESYVRKPHHKKKELNEKQLAREAWREHKQFKRDKAKAGWMRDGCPKWLKRQCNKDYRAWVRNCLSNGKDEEIGSKTRKDFFDPWMWS